MDNDYFASIRKDRRNKRAHVVVALGDAVVRLTPIPAGRHKACNAAGWVWDYAGVHSASGRRIRDFFEKADHKCIHICRQAKCEATGEFACHAVATAGVVDVVL